MPKADTKDKEVTILEDLQVKEVSVVDLPANLRRFIIVKRATEGTMPREAFAAGDQPNFVVIDDDTTEEEEIEAGDEEEVAKIEVSAEEAEADDAGAIDLLELTEDDEADEAEDDEEAEEEAGDPIGEIQEILKAVTVGQAVKPLNSALQQLMAAVNAAKKLGKKPLTTAIIRQVRGVMSALNLISGRAKAGKVEKVQPGTLQAATAALERLMSLVNQLKEMDQKEAFPEKMASEAKAIAGLLSGLLAKYPSPTAGRKAKPKAVAKSEGVDPVIVIKAGRKMKKTRLTKLREAVSLLTSILKELEGSTDMPKQEEKVKKAEGEEAEAETKKEGTEADVKKAEAEEEGATGLEEIKEGIAKLGAAITGLGEKVEGITKRVDDLEGAAPEGNAEEDPPEEVKKKKNIWDGVIPDYPTR